jgi:steroid delta-isomerase-like uncharacterized protein
MNRRFVASVSLVVVTFAVAVSAYVPQSKGHREQVIKFLDEVWSKGNLAYIDQAMDPDFVRHGHTAEGTVTGIPAFKDRVKEIRAAFTDYTVTLLDMTGVGNKATFNWQLRGNYVGIDKKLSPGRAVDIKGKTVWFFRGDKIVKEVVEMDQEEYYRQIQMALPYSEVENRAVVLSYLFEVLSQGNVSALEELVSENHVLHDVNNVKVVGLSNLRDHVQDLRTAFPDMSIAIHDVLADGDLVTARWTITGTHRGEWNGVPATNRKVEATGLSFMRLKDQKIQETWSIWDSLMVQLKPSR